MNILEQITDTKRQEVSRQKGIVPEQELQTRFSYNRTCNSLKSALLTPGASGIIAEFKLKSPSKGVINPSAQVEAVTKAYVTAGVSGLSVLTDHSYFGGNLANLEKARLTNPNTPILRKDFIIDDYQIVEAKAHGADVILLIAACLERKQMEDLAKTAIELGLEVLLEIHAEEELSFINESVDFVGINNRNLKTFEVDVETSVKLAKQIPEAYIKISESGLSEVETIQYLRRNGFNGFLIGETFMKTSDPGKACKELIDAL